jgi:hypothetical protein
MHKITDREHPKTNFFAKLLLDVAISSSVLSAGALAPFAKNGQILTLASSSLNDIAASFSCDPD